MIKPNSGQTTSSKRVNQDGKTSWNQYQGSKDSREVQVTQINIKDNKTGDHYFYNAKQGRSGVALGGAERSGHKK